MSLTRSSEAEGVLLVDKPRGHTSHDVIARLRGKLKLRRIGHAGTLDPMATGLLVVLVGKATSLSQYLISLDKEYTGTITLGVTTNSYDADGEVTARQPVPPLTAVQVKSAMAEFQGDQYQTPPMFSAVKVGGVPLYKLARKGAERPREPRFIRVYRWELTRFEPPELDFVLRCTKGTYVRALAHELGQKLGCGAHLSALRRTATDRLSVSQALPLEEILALPEPDLLKRLLPAREVVPGPIPR